MPLFGRRRDDGSKQEQEQAVQEREQSLAMLQAGDIPLQAQRRLDELRGREKPLFTSDLSVNEFLLSRQAGLRPISQVMGSSIYHVGFKMAGAWTTAGELPVPTEAINQCRWRALRRLQLEASRIGAHVVAAIRFTERDLDWSADLIECTVFGTAMRVEGAPKDSGLALTNLDGQALWKLYRAGYWPVGVCSGSSVVFSWAPWRGMFGGFGAAWYNQELTTYTAAQYEARNNAMARIHRQAQELRATGLVGVRIDQKQEMEVGENSTMPTSMTFMLSAIGTAVVPIPGADPTPAALRVLPLDT